MKKFVVLCLSLLAANICSASEAKLTGIDLDNWRLFMARAVAFQPKAVGFEKSAEVLQLKAYTGPGKEFYQNQKKVTDWPTIAIDGDRLKISDKDGQTVTLESVNLKKSEFLLNGRSFTLNPKKSAITQVLTFLAQKSAMKQSGFSLIASAYADNEVSSAAKGVATAIAAPYVGYALAFATAEAAVGTASISIYLVSVPVAGYAALDGIICGPVAGFYGVSGETFGQRFKNCSFKPYTLLGLSSRQRMRLRDLNCDLNGSIHAEVASPSGLKESRDFVVEQGKLQSIVLQDKVSLINLFPSPNGLTIDRAKTHAGKLSRPKNNKQLDEAQSLLTDFQVFQRLCADPEQKKQVLTAIAAKPNAAMRVEDKVTPEGLSEKAE